ncbi:MAG TPA: hypothetical protein VII75_05195, partial [Thermoanaerobaculia bacterium]
DGMAVARNISGGMAAALRRNRSASGFVRPQIMHDNKAHEVLRKHNISLEDVKSRKTSLHHLRRIVHAEQLPFDVFKALVKLRH